MRECLGWITNCSNEHSCPQNWLELAVSEIPASVSCHVCGQSVSLVVSEEELQAKARQQALAAFPVVPCTGFQAAQVEQRTPAPASYEQPAPSPAYSNPPPPARRALTWFVRLSNGDAIEIDKDTMIMGRSRTCDIVIPSAKVSRQHASVSRVNGELWIEDLGSANGVWINGEKITRIKVNPGDMFTVSDETLVFDAQ